mgnify:CR=1 FL=1
MPSAMALVWSDSAVQMLYVMYVWFPLIANGLILFLLTRLDVEKANRALRTSADRVTA